MLALHHKNYFENILQTVLLLFLLLLLPLFFKTTTISNSIQYDPVLMCQINVVINKHRHQQVLNFINLINTEAKLLYFSIQ